MLRRRLSAGALRQLHSQANAAPRAGPAATTKQARATIPSTPATPAQSKTLASGVLLSTQRNWKSETVVTLKAELKRRNLSQQGNKSTLISRLQSAETSALLPPVPPVSKELPPRARAASTSKPVASPVPTAPTAAPVPTAPKAAEHADTPDPVVAMSADKEVSSDKLSGHAPAPVTDQMRTSAPGLPISKGSVRSTALDIKFPKDRPDVEFDQVIPTLPHEFHARVPPNAASYSTKATSNSGPQVVTVASAGTHPGGGPVAPGRSIEDSHAMEYDVSDRRGLEAARAEENAEMAAEDAETKWHEKFPGVKLPSNPGEVVYEASSRPLNDEERNGVWVLVAGVVTVLAAAWVGEKIEKKQEKVHHEEKQKK